MDTSGCCGPNSALRYKFITPTEYVRALGRQHLTQYRICKEPNVTCFSVPLQTGIRPVPRRSSIKRTER